VTTTRAKTFVTYTSAFETAARGRSPAGTRRNFIIIIIIIIIITYLLTYLLTYELNMWK